MNNQIYPKIHYLKSTFLRVVTVSTSRFQPTVVNLRHTLRWTTRTMQLHAGKISTNSARRGLVATSLMLTATDQASLLLRSSNNNRSATLYRMRLILCSLLQLLHGLGFRMTTLGYLLLTNRSILTHSTSSQFLNQASIDIPVSSSQGRGLHSCATLPVRAIVPQQHVASSIESQASIDRIIYNREALSPQALAAAREL
jgi:hypothetical protein